MCLKNGKLERTVSAVNLDLNWRKMHWIILKCWKWLLLSRQCNQHKGCEGFAMLKSGVTFNEDAKCLGHSTNKIDAGVKETVLEANKLRSVK
jgi:hypothetical protein